MEHDFEVEPQAKRWVSWRGAKTPRFWSKVAFVKCNRDTVQPLFELRANSVSTSGDGDASPLNRVPALKCC
jgi:hypothetical protein